MKQKYIDFFKQAEESNEHWTEIAISDFMDEICRLMDEQEMNRAELAEKIDSSPAYITKVLRGNVNFTLATMTKLARAFGNVVRIKLAPEDVIVRWDYATESADTRIDVLMTTPDESEDDYQLIGSPGHHTTFLTVPTMTIRSRNLAQPTPMLHEEAA